MSDAREQLIERLRTFLADPKDPDKLDNTSWDEVKPEDVQELAELIDLIIRLKWGQDLDSDAPVTAALIDRTRYMRANWSLIPSRWPETTQEAWDDVLRAQMNLSKAMTLLDIVLGRAKEVERET